MYTVKMLRRYLPLWFLVLGCIQASAQPQPFPGNIIPASRIAFPQIQAYLGLTSDQIARLVQNLTDYNQLVAQRQQRIYQVQSEIRDETAKSPLDPAALGIRYAEIESICRNVHDEAVAAQTRNLAILTDAQKAKLKALEDAVKLLPVINEAQNVGILAPPGPNGIIYGVPGVQWFDTSSFSSVPLSGCQQAAAFGRVTTGQFTFTP
jgi:hypothetical protein